MAIRAAIEKAGVSGELVDEVIMGQVLTAGCGQAPARQAALGAGLSNRVPCMTINKVCGSGMKAAMLGGQSIRLGESSLVVAGGMESMSNAPYVLDKARTGYRMGHGVLADSMIQDGLWDPYGDCHMGACADATSVSENLSRSELDEFAAMSYERAIEAQAKGTLGSEIVAVEIKGRKGDVTVIAQDEELSKGNPSKLPSLRPAFSADGATTAGNASSLNDGACALVLSSSEFAIKQGVKPMARLVGWTTFAQEPQWFTTAPAMAVQGLMEKFGLKVEDIDLFEINEAFAVVALAVARKVQIPLERLNVNGGAVALGHPIGMSGARLILTATLELRRRGGRYAVASPCIGGGESTAVLIENLAV
jgi:acetyl-CoA C-acetyltransferase